MTGIDWKHQHVAESSGELGARIKAARLGLGLSRSRAAKIAEVDRSTWTKWEDGKSAPYEANYVKIERTLRWPPGYISGANAAGADLPATEPAPPLSPVPTISQAEWASYTDAQRRLIEAAIEKVRQTGRRSQRRPAS